MFGVLSPLNNSAFIALLAFASAADQAPREDPQAERRRLEAQREEVEAKVRDRTWMQSMERATLTRLAIERGWKECAANEAIALTKASQRPAKLIAEAAVKACREWELALDLALRNGAYPYVSGYRSADGSSLPSMEDMTALAELDAREAALTRIRLWRAGALAASLSPNKEAPSEALPQPATAPAPVTASPPPASAQAAAEGGEGEVITVVGYRRGCRVRLADRTLTDRELKANAKAWAANGTPLQVVRPRGADHHCLAKIVFSLGEQGVRLFQFLDRSPAPRDRRD